MPLLLTFGTQKPSLNAVGDAYDRHSFFFPFTRCGAVRSPKCRSSDVSNRAINRLIGVDAFWDLTLTAAQRSLWGRRTGRPSLSFHSRRLGFASSWSASTFYVRLRRAAPLFIALDGSESGLSGATTGRSTHMTVLPGRQGQSLARSANTTSSAIDHCQWLNHTSFTQPTHLFTISLFIISFVVYNLAW